MDRIITVIPKPVTRALVIAPVVGIIVATAWTASFLKPEKPKVVVLPTSDA